MARRVLKPLTPLLVALVALVLGFLAIGPSFADTPAGDPIPSVSVSPGPAVAPPAASVQPEEMVPTGPATPKSKAPKIPQAESTPISCSNCMAPPGA